MSEHRDNDNRNRGRRGENHQKRIGRPDNVNQLIIIIFSIDNLLTFGSHIAT